MKHLRTFLVAVFILFLAGAAFSQQKFAGRVVDVIDGKTIVIELTSARITAVLQNIEVPEPGQPLNKIVVDHLRQLVMGKVIVFQARSLMRTKTAGRVMLGDVDISQQMIRDGAAWLAPIETTGDEFSDRSSYAASEAQAKADHLGVWSIKNLQPAWEYRSEKLTQERNIERAKYEQVSKIKPVQKDPVPSTQRSRSGRTSQQMSIDAWTDVNVAAAKESYGLNYKTIFEGRAAVVSTSPEYVYVSSGKDQQKLACRAAYGYDDLPDGRRLTIAMLGLQTVSEDTKFAQNLNSLMIVADGKRIPIAGIIGVSKQEYYGVHEGVVYKISKEAFGKIANAKKVAISIGGYKGELSPANLALFKQLFDAMD